MWAGRIVALVLLWLFTFGRPIIGRAQDINWVEMSGHILLAGLPFSAAGMIWYHEDRAGWHPFAAAGAATMATTFLLKHFIPAKRPNGKDHSFPSGHSSVSFFAAEFIRERYGPKWGGPAYMAATFVAYSRVSAKKHYLRDVIAGAIIGIAFSAMCTDAYAGKNQKDLLPAPVTLCMLALPPFGNTFNFQAGTDGRQVRLSLQGTW